MNATATLRLDRLQVRNFRCFARCEIDLHPTLTVIVAENGRGKTALLDAIACALGPLVDELSGVRQWGGIAPTDVRLALQEGAGMAPVVPAGITAHGIIDGQRLEWGMTLGGVSNQSRTSSRDLRESRAAAKAMRSRLDAYALDQRDLAPPLPLVAYYGTGRLWAEQRLTEGRRKRDPTPLGRLAGYKDCLSSSSSFKAFAAWYEDRVRAASSPTSVAIHRDEQPALQLAAVRKATRIVLEPTGWSDLDCALPPKNRFGQEEGRAVLVVDHAIHGRLPLSQLSDGVRNMVTLVADIAHRCARLNPQFGEQAADRTPGILLIDEIDMHLHPGWQQKVIGTLRAAFPKIQFIVTTHSPQVLTTVAKESVRLISVTPDGVGVAEPPEVSTLGRESADALAYMFDTDSKPQQLKLPSGLGVVDAVHRLEQFVRAGQEHETTTQDLLTQLQSFGVEIPAVDLKLWRFMAGRQKEV